MNITYGGLVSTPRNRIDTNIKNSTVYTFNGTVIERTHDIPKEFVYVEKPVESFELTGAESIDDIGDYTYIISSITPQDYNVAIASIESSVTAPTTGLISITTSGTTGASLTVTQMPSETETVTITIVATLDNGDTITSTQDVELNVPIQVSLDLVDLGLPSGILWAKGNIVKDANDNYSIGNETDYGCYFSWGNIEPHFPNGTTFSYNWGSSNTGPYASTPGASIPFTSQTKNADYSADSGYDAARELFGGSWRMPTATEFKELYDNTDNEWTTINGVNGRKFMKKTDHSVYIFFPAAGSGSNTSLSSRGSSGYYWSSSLCSAGSGYNLYFYGSNVNPQDYNYRYVGCSVRAVQSSN